MNFPNSIRCNRCVNEGFGGVFVLSCCFLDFFVGVGVFVIGLSQISSFFSLPIVQSAALPFEENKWNVQILWYIRCLYGFFTQSLTG